MTYLLDFKDRHENTVPKLKDWRTEKGEVMNFTFIRKAFFPTKYLIVKDADGNFRKITYGGLTADFRKWENFTNYTVTNKGLVKKSKRDIGYYDFEVTINQQ